MLYKFPVNYYVDNLIFSENGCWAMYELVGYDYDHQSNANKMKILRNFSNFLKDVTTQIKIHVIPVKQEFDRSIRETYKNIRNDDPLKKIAIDYAEGHISYLKNVQAKKVIYDPETGQKLKVISDENDDYKFYIGIKLDDIKEKDYLKKIKDYYEYLILDPKRGLEKILGLQGERILDSKIRALKKASNNFYEMQRQRIEIKEVDNKIVQWLYRRINYRGLNSKVEVTDFVPQGRKYFTKDNEIEIEPRQEEIRSLFKGKIKQKDRYLQIVTEEGISNQTFLSLTDRPKMRFPGSEFIFLLQKISGGIEACINITMLDKYKGDKAVEGHRKKVGSEIENANDVNLSIDEDTKDAIYEVYDMQEELRNNKVLTETSVTFIVADENVEEMEKKAARIINLYKDNELILERSIADQYKLYLETIPGTERYTKDYTKLMNVDSISGMGIGATRLLGDESGFYIGTTGELGKKVFLNMARAPLENLSASATAYGDLGYGKSFNMNLLVLLHVIFGGYALIFDPKNERSDWGKSLPWLDPFISITSLSADEKFKGMLDPFNIYKSDKKEDIEDACSLAQNIVAELVGLNAKDEEFIVLKEALTKLKKSPRRSMTDLINIIKEAGENEKDEYAKYAKKLARNLKSLDDIGMSKLLIGTGNEKALNFNNRINILQISNLKMPSAETAKEDYTDEEVVSSVLMMVMSQFAKRFAQTPRPNFKLILFDESWFMTRTAEGIKLMDFLTRTGRSLFTGCIFNGHSVLDIPSEKIQNTISYKFCFHTDEEAEAKRMCKYLKIDESTENIHRLMNLGNAECMFKDLDGRVGTLKFDAVYNNIIKCFNTTPKTAIEDIEEA